MPIHITINTRDVYQRNINSVLCTVTKGGWCIEWSEQRQSEGKGGSRCYSEVYISWNN